MTRAWRWLPAVALVGIAVAVLAIGASRPSHPTLDQKVLHIAGEVRCPVCEGQSAAQSDAASSVQIRNQIRQQLQQGRTESQILAGIVQAYGSGILEKPPARGVSLTVWVVPVVAFVVAVAGLALAFSRWRSRSTAAGPSVEDRILVDEALRSGDGGARPATDGGSPAGGGPGPGRDRAAGSAPAADSLGRAGGE